MDINGTALLEKTLRERKFVEVDVIGHIIELTFWDGSVMEFRYSELYGWEVKEGKNE
jgi:hypothetical protein